MTNILHAIDHAIELLDDAYPSVDQSIRETLERAQVEITRLRALTTPQPIETAPANDWVLVFHRRRGWLPGVLSDPRFGGLQWNGPNNETLAQRDVTNWLPLPEDPK